MENVTKTPASDVHLCTTAKAQALRETLRQATKAEHQALHRHRLLQKLTDSRLTEREYFQILHAFRRYYLQQEAEFGLVKCRFPKEAAVLQWLADDLALSHRSIGSLENSPGTDAGFSDSLFCRYLGYLYVKQGSTLGAVFIKGRLGRHALLGRLPHVFFTGYGADTEAVWQLFMDFLARNHRRWCDYEQDVVQAALVSFQQLKTCLDDATTHPVVPTKEPKGELLNV